MTPSGAALWGPGLAGAALLAAPWAGVVDEYSLTLLVIYGLLALSLALVWGLGGILCFGQAAFFGLGAYSYAVAAINLGESTVPVLLSIVVPALLAAAVGAMMFYGRVGDVYLGVITLVVTLILFKYVNSTAGPAYVVGQARLGGFNGIPGFPVLNVPGRPDWPLVGLALYYVSAAVLWLAWVGCRALARSAYGRQVAGLRENELRMQLLGYDVRWAKTVLFTAGGAMAGLAGALYACWAEIVTPGLFSLGQSAEIIVWVLVGGVGTLAGPVLGAMALGALKMALGAQQWVDNSLVMGTILVVFVLLLPRGIAPIAQRGWQQFSARRRRRGGVRVDGQDDAQADVQRDARADGAIDAIPPRRRRARRA